MRRIVQALLALLVLLGGMVFASGTAQACSCAVGNERDQFTWATAVFSGQIVDRSGSRRDKQQTQSGQTVYGPGSFTYTVAVDAVYKGQVNATQNVVAGTQSSACGVVFPTSGPILVFGSTSKKQASRDSAPDTYFTGLCSGSAATDVVPASYGTGSLPLGASPTSTPSPVQTRAPEPTQPAVDFSSSTGSTWAVMFGIALGVALVVTGAVWLVQRRDRKRRPATPRG